MYCRKGKCLVLPFYPLGKRSERGKGLASEPNVGNGAYNLALAPEQVYDL